MLWKNFINNEKKKNKIILIVLFSIYLCFGNKLIFKKYIKSILKIIEISVIIPVYNSGNYLPLCLNSVISQELINIEIICVDDGSTDNSLEI